MNEKYPVHDKRRLRFNSPEGMIHAFRRFPLNKDFIDWVVDQGYRLVYSPYFKGGEGAVPGGKSKSIFISPYGSQDTIDLVIMHELVHVAHSKDINWECGSDEAEKYDSAIEEIAKDYVKDKAFLAYIKRKIPSEHLILKE